jgi:hypothetical protein
MIGIEQLVGSRGSFYCLIYRKPRGLPRCWLSTKNLWIPATLENKPLCRRFKSQLAAERHIERHNLRK